MGKLKTTIISSPGKKPIKFKKGALHQELGVPQGKKIPGSKMRAAMMGKLGPLAKRRAQFAENVLTGPKRG